MNYKLLTLIPGPKSFAFLWPIGFLVVFSVISILGIFTRAQAALPNAAAPTLAIVSPVEAYNFGPTTITITGTGFFTDTNTSFIVPQIALNNASLPSVTFVSSTTLTATVPADLPAGTYTLTVTNPDNQAASLVNAFVVLLSRNGSINAWQATTPMTVSREALSVVTANGYLYAIGGQNSNGALNSVERAQINADGSLGVWQSTTSMLSPRSFAAATVIGDCIYVLGGNAGNNPFDTVERTVINPDGSLGTWEYTSAMVKPRHFLAVATKDSYIYALGGRSVENWNEPLASVERATVNLDGSLGPWQIISSLNEARYLLAASEVGGYIYVLGGHGLSGSYLNSVERAAVLSDGTIGNWQFVTPMNMPREGLGAVIARAHLYAMGGYNGNENVSIVEQASISSDGTLGSWEIVKSMTRPRVYLAAAAEADHIYAIGGYAPSGTQNSVEWAETSPPSVMSFSLLAVRSDQETTVRVNGTNILPIPSLQLEDSINLSSGFVSTTTLTATIPSGLANGWYTATLTNGDGRTAMLTHAVRVDGPGPVFVGDYGLTINDGALFTNKITVTLTVGSRSDTALMQVSNDGGFAGVQWETYTSHKTWQITQYGNYVIPRVVYVRYKDINGNISSTFQDDIILDVTAPTGSVEIVPSISQGGSQSASTETAMTELVSISISNDYSHIVYLPLVLKNLFCPSTGPANVALHMSAQDDVSGVADMLISNVPSFSCATWEPYTRTKAWYVPPGTSTTVYVRFRDNAGNVSDVVTNTITIPLQ